MPAQRPPGAAPRVAATAGSLPFKDQSFDAAMAFSTVHHWQDPLAGLREMRRVARRFSSDLARAAQTASGDNEPVGNLPSSGRVTPEAFGESAWCRATSGR
jgi:SAM-dependent methyltransferase